MTGRTSWATTLISLFWVLTVGFFFLFSQSSVPLTFLTNRLQLDARNGTSARSKVWWWKAYKHLLQPSAQVGRFLGDKFTTTKYIVCCFYNNTTVNSSFLALRQMGWSVQRQIWHSRVSQGFMRWGKSTRRWSQLWRTLGRHRIIWWLFLCWSRCYVQLIWITKGFG